MKKITVLAAAILATGYVSFAQTDAQKAAAEAAQAIAQAPETEVQAPKPSYWTKSLMTQLNFAQNSYFNWAKGGNNNVAFTSYIDAHADYKKGDMLWTNRLQLDYGFLYSEDKPIMQKSKDRMLLESNWGLKATEKLYYSANFTFLNQFTHGYTYGTPSVQDPTIRDWKDARTLKSGFLAPGIVTLGLGLKWVPNKWLTINVSPLTGGFTIVKEEQLRKAYGMVLKPEYEGEVDPIGSYYRPARFELGAQVVADAKLKINDNFEASTHLILFSNYLKNPQNIRVNWDNLFMWKLAKYFTLTLTTNLIYDDTVLITDKNGVARKNVQFLEALQFGFTYTFSSKKD
ncbi:MAG: DUF3078 domain-containing protein [Bacteroidales bacterium]|nr:DUF3078 domain-containing protein [Bacteroidales bacterium]